ncbi:MAG: SUMF1/EgtB/PvdO family nonheme iron enzyme, partial [Planctomycetota bacterium]|nr:SUMF1/EgtB/PvdO family nonheme iron enzyme [Planctomycetota bacterium]
PMASAFRKARRHKEVTLAIMVIAFSAFGALGYSIRQTGQAARQQAADRERSLRTALDDAHRLLTQAKDTMAHLNDTARGDFQQNAGRARAQIADASAAFRQVEGISAGHAEAKRALEKLKKMDNELEVRRFIYKARAFLFPGQDRQGEPSAPPNYAGAEFAAQEAVDREPGNTEAKELLHLAVGIRAVTIESSDPADVHVRRIVDGSGRPLRGGDGPGQALGRTPVSGTQLEPGLYIVTFKRGELAPQEATLAVTRDAREEDLRLKVTLNTPEENMVLIRPGNVTLPQVGTKSVPAFAIDRFEYPNKAGTVPVTGLSLLEARSKCKERGKQLCNSAQWLRACMGDEEWRYPYGKTYVSRACATGFDGTVQKTPLVSGLFARCRTPEGVYDMSGNVAEWTEPERGEQQETVFGGDWTSPTRFADLTVSCIARSLPEEVNKERLGFRCCKSR